MRSSRGTAEFSHEANRLMASGACEAVPFEGRDDLADRK